MFRAYLTTNKLLSIPNVQDFLYIGNLMKLNQTGNLEVIVRKNYIEIAHSFYSITIDRNNMSTYECGHECTLTFNIQSIIELLDQLISIIFNQGPNSIKSIFLNVNYDKADITVESNGFETRSIPVSGVEFLINNHQIKRKIFQAKTPPIPKKVQPKEVNGIQLPSGEDIKADNDTPEDDLCQTCMDNKLRTVNLPCGHMFFCISCAKSHVQVHLKKNCPVCNTGLTEVKQVFK